MQITRLLMGMPITIIVVPHIQNQDSLATVNNAINAVFDYFQDVDARFSTYKKESEISQINRGVISQKDMSKDMRIVFRLSEKTKKETEGFFNIKKADGTIDPSGLTKGWAIYNGAKILQKKGFENFSINAGGDIQVYGKNEKHEKWKIGIKNPFNEKESIKTLALSNKGIATSGTYIRGQHVYNPHNPDKQLISIVSITVIAPNVYEADRFATACFAMQEKGIYFLEKQKDLEGYMIDKKGIATMTSGFEKYVIQPTMSSW